MRCDVTFRNSEQGMLTASVPQSPQTPGPGSLLCPCFAFQEEFDSIRSYSTVWYDFGSLHNMDFKAWSKCLLLKFYSLEYEAWTCCGNWEKIGCVMQPVSQKSLKIVPAAYFFFFQTLQNQWKGNKSPCCQHGLIWNSLASSDPCASKHEFISKVWTAAQSAQEF